MKLLLFILLISCSGFAQTISPRSIAINADATAAFNAFAVRLVDPLLSTALSTAIDQITVSVRIDAGANVKNGDAIRIDDEVLLVTAKAGRDLTVTRGHLNTVPAPHLTDAFVAVLRYPSLAEFARSKAINAIRELVARELPSVNAEAAAVEARRKTTSEAAVQ